MKRTAEICPFCGRKISKSNLSKHIRTHEKGTYKNVYHVDHEGLNCKFCNKLCKNTNSLIQHELRCPLNSDRKDYIKSNFNTKGIESWNKGKTKETDERILTTGIKISKALKGKPGHPHTQEAKDHLSDVAKERGFGGFNMRNKGILYNDTKFDSSYEVTVAKSLDENNIKWEKPHRFKYYENNDLNCKWHWYTPDLYLPDYDIYLDPKNDFLIENINPRLGYKDTHKISWVMEYNNIKIIVLTSEQLNWDIIKQLL